jgi:hypothetical protein
VKQNRIVGNIGCKGAGKSFQNIQLFKRSHRAICFDSCGEYDYGLVTMDRTSVCDLVEMPRFRVAFRPRAGEKELEEDFAFLSELAYAAGRCDFFVEEIDLFCTSSSAIKGLDLITRYGRHQEVNLYYSTRRTQEISKGLTSQTDEYKLFRVAEPRDVEELERRFGKENAARVVRLPDHQFITVDVRKLSARPLEGQEDENANQETGDSGVVRDGAGVAAGESDAVAGAAGTAARVQ